MSILSETFANIHLALLWSECSMWKPIRSCGFPRSTRCRAEEFAMQTTKVRIEVSHVKISCATFAVTQRVHRSQGLSMAQLTREVSRLSVVRSAHLSLAFCRLSNVLMLVIETRKLLNFDDSSKNVPVKPCALYIQAHGVGAHPRTPLVYHLIYS